MKKQNKNLLQKVAKENKKLFILEILLILIIILISLVYTSFVSIPNNLKMKNNDINKNSHRSLYTDYVRLDVQVNNETTDISNCSILNLSNTLYTQTSNIIPGLADCIVIGAENITYDCVGYWISNESSSAYAIFSNKTNTTIKNCKINMSSVDGTSIRFNRANSSYIFNNTFGHSYYGIFARNTSNIKIENNTFIDISRYGIYFQIGKDNKVFNNYFNISGTAIYTSITNTTIWKNNITRGSTGIDIESSNNNLTENTINSASAYGIYHSLASYNIINQNKIMNSYYGVYFGASSLNNNFTDNNISLGNTYDVFAIKGSGSTNNQFLNSTYNTSKETLLSGSSLTRKWYYKAYVNNTDGNPVSGADVHVYAVSRVNTLVVNMTTNSDGWTNVSEIIDYTNDGGTRTYYSNYSIVAFNNSATDVNSHNVTLEHNILSDAFTILVDTAAPVISSHSRSVSSSSATISWLVNEPGNATITETNGKFSSVHLLYASEPTFTITGLTTSTDYSYNITSCDVLNNCATDGPHTFTTLSSSTSSIGGGISLKSYTISKSELRMGVARYLKKDNIVYLNYPNIGMHSINVNSISATSVSLTISSTPIIATLSIGDTKTFDLDGNGINDLSLTLDSIDKGVAKLRITGLNIPSDTEIEKKKQKPIFIEELPKPETPLGCTANLSCGEWSKCRVDYNLNNLIENKIQLKGVQERKCIDLNKCLGDVYQTQECTTKIPVTAQKTQKCFKDYIEIRDLNNVLISRLEMINRTTNQTTKKLNIQLLFDDDYCPYCYDGIKDYDEDEIDCVYFGKNSCKLCK